MKIFAKVGKERIELLPMKAAEFETLIYGPIRRGIPTFYNVENSEEVWPEPADYVSIIREE